MYVSVGYLFCCRNSSTLTHIRAAWNLHADFEQIHTHTDKSVARANTARMQMPTCHSCFERNSLALRWVEKPFFKPLFVCYTAHVQAAAAAFPHYLCILSAPIWARAHTLSHTHTLTLQRSARKPLIALAKLLIKCGQRVVGVGEIVQMIWAPGAC